MTVILQCAFGSIMGCVITQLFFKKQWEYGVLTLAALVLHILIVLRLLP